jgi:hypothetical protein
MNIFMFLNDEENNLKINPNNCTPVIIFRQPFGIEYCISLLSSSSYEIVKKMY